MSSAAGPPSPDPVLGMSTCGDCSLGCAVSCADGREASATQARQTLVASGVGILFLAVVPGLVSGSLAVQSLAFLAAWCGAATSTLAGVAVRRGRPGGDRPARLAYRVLPVGVALMALTWLAAAVNLLAR